MASYLDLPEKKIKILQIQILGFKLYFILVRLCLFTRCYNR